MNYNGELQRNFTLSDSNSSVNSSDSFHSTISSKCERIEDTQKDLRLFPNLSILRNLRSRINYLKLKMGVKINRMIKLVVNENYGMFRRFAKVDIEDFNEDNRVSISEDKVIQNNEDKINSNLTDFLTNDNNFNDNKVIYKQNIDNNEDISQYIPLISKDTDSNLLRDIHPLLSNNTSLYINIENFLKERFDKFENRRIEFNDFLRCNKQDNLDKFDWLNLKRKKYREFASSLSEVSLDCLLTNPIESNCQLVHNKEGVRVWKKEYGAGRLLLRTEFIVPINPKDYVAFSSNSNQRKIYDSNTSDIRNLENIESGLDIIYVASKRIGTIYPRDLVNIRFIHALDARKDLSVIFKDDADKLGKDSSNLLWASCTCSVDHPDIPEKPGLVRMDSRIGSYIAVPIKTPFGLWSNIAMFNEGNPKGWIPSSVTRLLAAKIIPGSIEKLLATMFSYYGISLDSDNKSYSGFAYRKLISLFTSEMKLYNQVFRNIENSEYLIQNNANNLGLFKRCEVNKNLKILQLEEIEYKKRNSEEYRNLLSDNMETRKESQEYQINKYNNELQLNLNISDHEDNTNSISRSKFFEEYFSYDISEFLDKFYSFNLLRKMILSTYLVNKSRTNKQDMKDYLNSISSPKSGNMELKGCLDNYRNFSRWRLLDTIDTKKVTQNKKFTNSINSPEIISSSSPILPLTLDISEVNYDTLKLYMDASTIDLTPISENKLTLEESIDIDKRKIPYEQDNIEILAKNNLLENISTLSSPKQLYRRISPSSPIFVLAEIFDLNDSYLIDQTFYLDGLDSDIDQS
ncbi:uncharacterized protein CMU_043270 [Cryptosporidium muris RN66]|uniref:START domain-containing protein n=1 Tax=Cryptosporidium muris (strain RN66) TaxID=441375 RepID=B6AAL2_CRYMR|nr:uncharacterized protein CMU_043270 [Cryptosporidium muris RN66]EEA05253.1 hypothetical protein, conserved [Cryptosporidium muris RN66]|eukprot:XP_002139602.1 hypothetical protein [Cryptosporidium muris RN66]